MTLSCLKIILTDISLLCFIVMFIFRLFKIHLYLEFYEFSFDFSVVSKRVTSFVYLSLVNFLLVGLLGVFVGFTLRPRL